MRKFFYILLLIPLLLLFGLPVQAAAITVGGGCSLIDAISSANTDSSVGGCVAGSGADTITLTGNVSLTAVDNTTDGSNGLPQITSDITIMGNSFTISRAGGSPSFRIFAVGLTGSLTLRYVTISGGLATVGATTCHSSLSCGGGIFNRGTTIIEYSTITGNEADVGGGINSNETASVLTIRYSSISANTTTIDGGGLYVLRSQNVTIEGSEFLNNVTSFHASGRDPNGAGIYIHQGKVTISSTLFEGNQAANTNADAFPGAPNVGGAMFITSGQANITASIFRNNVGRRAAGAIFNVCCLAGNPAGMTPGIYISDSQFINNRSTLTGNGGAIFNSSGTTGTIDRSVFVNNTAIAFGGAIFSRNSTTISNSTFSGNSASDGGGIYTESGTTTVSYSTIADNTASNLGDGIRRVGGTLTINNSIIRNASAGANCAGTITNGNNNLADDATCGTITNSASINLGSLQDNGGFGDTYALLTGSSALDVGNNTTCAANPINNLDQRGMPRDDGNCDIGAYEAIYSLPTLHFVTAGTNIREGDTATVRLILDNRSGTLVAGSTVTVYLVISSGSAFDSLDYSTTTIPVSMTVPAPGSNVLASFDVSAILDSLSEGAETVTFSIFAIDGAAILSGIQAHTVTIRDFLAPVPTATNTAEPQVAVNPSISKLGFLRDGQIEWLITVTNNSSSSISNLVVTDTLPANLISLNLPQGVSSHSSGQNLSLTIAQLNAGQSITMSVFTALADGAVTNTACLRDYQLCSTGSVVSSLPNTGEVLWWSSFLPVAGIALLGVFVLLKSKRSV